MSGRGKRVLVYTAALLLSPVPVMPFERGTREFALSLVACGAALALGSFYALRGELRGGPLGALGMKIAAASAVTLLFGASLVAGSIIYLALD
jgi:hypothetical protein